jgi:hypothetical protein
MIRRAVVGGHLARGVEGHGRVVAFRFPQGRMRPGGWGRFAEEVPHE